MKRIVLTRSASGNRAWKDYFVARGFYVYLFPTIEMIPVKPSAKVIDVLKNIDAFDWVIITSIEALRAAQTIAKQSDINLSAHHIRSLGVLGKETAVAARAMGYRVAFRPPRPMSETLAQELPLAKKSSVLFLRSTIASRTIPNVLTKRGAKVTDLAVYRTVSVGTSDLRFERLLKEGAIHYLTFASPSAVQGFFKRIDGKISKKALAIPVVAIGPTVAKTLKKWGFKDIHVANDPNPKSMAEAMV